MANDFRIIPTLFTSLRGGSVELGFRWWDSDNSDFDHGSSYNPIPDSDLEFFALVLKNYQSDRFSDILAYCYHEKTGIYIGITYYTWEQWSPVYRQSIEDNGFTLE